MSHKNIGSERKIKPNRNNRIKMTRAEFSYQIVINCIMVLILIVCIVPVLYVVGMSLSSEQEMIKRNYFIIIPEQPTLIAYKYLFKYTNFAHGLLVSLARTICGVIAALILTIPLGYTLARQDVPFRKPVLFYVIVTMVLSAGMIPTYLLMSKLKLLNTFAVYIVPGCANTYGILVTKLFVEGLPDDIIESAELDGANELQKMFHIAVPLLKPTICALGLFAAVTHWNDWFTAMLYVRDSDLFPVQLIIRNLFEGINLDEVNIMSTNNSKISNTSVRMAGVVVAIIPILCVYPFLQKYFIYGMYTGSVKE